jgi:hypothetical protein
MGNKCCRKNTMNRHLENIIYQYINYKYPYIEELILRTKFIKPEFFDVNYFYYNYSSISYNNNFKYKDNIPYKIIRQIGKNWINTHIIH